MGKKLLSLLLLLALTACISITPGPKPEPPNPGPGPTPDPNPPVVVVEDRGSVVFAGVSIVWGPDSVPQPPEKLTSMGVQGKAVSEVYANLGKALKATRQVDGGWALQYSIVGSYKKANYIFAPNGVLRRWSVL